MSGTTIMIPLTDEKLKELGEDVRLINWHAKNLLYVLDALKQYSETGKLDGYNKYYIDHVAEQYQVFFHTRYNDKMDENVLAAIDNCQDGCPLTTTEGNAIIIDLAACRLCKNLGFDRKKPALDNLEAAILQLRLDADKLYVLKDMACSKFGSIQRYVQINDRFYREVKIGDYFAHTPATTAEKTALQSGDLAFAVLNGEIWTEKRIRDVSEEDAKKAELKIKSLLNK